MNENIDSKLNLESESSTVLSSNIVINRVKELYRKGEITLEEVKGEASGMILGAFETTALTVNHTLILLAMFPHHQELVFEELKEVFPAGGDFEVEYEDLQKLVYLDRVLNETLRLLPAVPISLRDVKEDLRLSNGVLVPKGVIMGIDIFNIHRNRDLWGHNADAFDPDRFLPDNIRQRHPYAFIPYSKGKRNCIVNMNQRTKYMDKYGSTVLAWIGIRPIIVSRDAKIAEDVLTAPQCINRISRLTKAMENIYGQGLMTLQGLR
ncbi:probable cytochrome P450 313a3 [Drosophila bipectinata]|uniref:probable cytochrome P450 313a3 n=1 Tax=Drosophila bipectinata TaxID=42026 RepID=UPI0038B3F1F1